MLIVVEDGNVHAITKLAFDVETFRRFDVFEVDATNGGLHGGDDVHQFVGVAFGQLNIKHINASKFLKQATFALHDGLASEGANVAQAQHRRAIGDDSDQVAARGVVIGFGWIGLYVETWECHAGRVGQGQIALVGQSFGRRNGNLARRWVQMVFTCGIAQRNICWGHDSLLLNSGMMIRALPPRLAKRVGESIFAI